MVLRRLGTRPLYLRGDTLNKPLLEQIIDSLKKQAAFFADAHNGELTVKWTDDVVQQPVRLTKNAKP